MNEEFRDELYSILHEIMLSDYEFTRNYRNFLEVSRSYFTASATNNRNMHSILDRIVTLENNVERSERQPQRQPQRQPYTNSGRYGNFNQYANNSVNNLQDTINPIYNRNNNGTLQEELSNTTNLTRNLPNMNSFWNGLLTRRSNQNITRQNRTTTGNGNRPMNTSNFITLLSNSLLQNELLNSQLQRERMPTEEEIDNACEVLLFRDCSNNNNNNQTRCPIDMLDFEPDDSIMRITHCGHIFREANLRRNFQTSPSCPMCRHNIVQNNTTRVENNQTRENNNPQINQTTESSDNIINTIMSQIRDNPNTITGNDSFLDASGNNVSVEYSVSTHFI